MWKFTLNLWNVLTTNLHVRSTLAGAQRRLVYLKAESEIFFGLKLKSTCTFILCKSRWGRQDQIQILPHSWTFVPWRNAPTNPPPKAEPVAARRSPWPIEIGAWPDSLNLNVLHQDRKLGELALFFFMHIMCHHLKSYSLTSGIQYSNLCTSITRAPSIHHILISQPIFFSFVCIIRCQIWKSRY